MILLGNTSFGAIKDTWEPIERFVSECSNEEWFRFRTDDILFLMKHGIQVIVFHGDKSLEISSFEEIDDWTSSVVDVGLVFDDPEQETWFRLKYL